MVVHLLRLNCDLRSRVELSDDRRLAEALQKLLLEAFVDTRQSAFRSVDDVHVGFVHVDVHHRRFERAIH